jgi:glycosyltransferase involved in cell wall biosynthesis
MEKGGGVKPTIHILHNERLIDTTALIESFVVRDSFKITKSSRLNLDANLIYTQAYASSDVIHALAYNEMPYVVHMGGDIWYELSEDPKRLYFVNRVLHRATLIVANSAFLYRIVRANGFDNAIFLPGGLWGFDESIHGIVPNRFKPRNVGSSNHPTLIMSIATKVKKKYVGIEKFMKAAKEYLQTVNARVICAGEVFNQGYANRMQHEYGVNFIGRRRDWSSYLPAATIFIHPSMFDCFPRALAEAKCAGVPSIAFRVAGNVEVGDSPIYVDPDSEVEIVSALRALVECQDLRAYLGWLGRKNALRKTMQHRGDYPSIFKILLEEGPKRLIRECKEAVK